MAQKDTALLRGLSVEQRGDKHHILSGNGRVQSEESVGGKALLSTALFSFKIIVLSLVLYQEKTLMSIKLIFVVEWHI